MRSAVDDVKNGGTEAGTVFTGHAGTRDSALASTRTPSAAGQTSGALLPSLQRAPDPTRVRDDSSHRILRSDRPMPIITAANSTVYSENRATMTLSAKGR